MGFMRIIVKRPIYSIDVLEVDKEISTIAKSFYERVTETVRKTA